MSDRSALTAVFCVLAGVLLASVAARGGEVETFSYGEIEPAVCTPPSVGLLSFRSSNFYRNIAMRGTVVYAATSSHVNLFNFRAIDISNRSAPVLRGVSILLGDMGSDPSIEFSSSHAWVPTTLGLATIDISNPTEPGSITRFEVPGLTPDNVRVSGLRAYVIGREKTNNRYRMSIVDIGSPTVPVQLGFFAVDGSSDFDFNWKDIEVLGNIAYAGAPALLGSGGAIRSIDVSNPTSPREVGRFTDPNIFNVKLATWRTNLVALGNRHLLVIDVSNPALPVLITKIETGGTQSEDLDVVGDRAFVADVVSDRVFIFDLSNLPQITLAGSASLDAYRLAADEHTAAVVLYNDEVLTLLDISSCFSAPQRRRAVRR